LKRSSSAPLDFFRLAIGPIVRLAADSSRPPREG
jgi:hypothetical protein